MAEKVRFDLFAILEWTAAIAFLCTLLVGAGTKATWTYEFPTLPADDSKLVAWLSAESHNDVTVTRVDNSVTLATEGGFFSGSRDAFVVLPKPPWLELGYTTPQGTRGSTQWTMFSASPRVWLAGFGILIAMGLIRRRYVKPMQVAGSDDSSD